MTDSTARAHRSDAPSRPAGLSLIEKTLPMRMRRGEVGEAGKRYSETLNRGFELTLTLVVFGVIGALIDRAAGTSPLFTLGLGILAFVGVSLKLWLAYDLEMRDLEANAPWARRPAAADAPAHDEPEAQP